MREATWLEIWNKCDYCGRFIGLDEFSDKPADRILVSPDTEFTVETYETFHMECKES